MEEAVKLPKSKSEVQERRFWARVDLSKYFDRVDFERVSFPNLKPSSRSISIRLPAYLLIRAKEQANELRIPYQSLLKRYIAQGVFKK